MLDTILKAYLNDFKNNWGLNCNESELFENFMNYCILTKQHLEKFDIDDVHTGGGNDTAIDGLAIMVNDHITQSKEEILYLVRELNRFEVKFIFIQSKLSSNFDIAEIGNFLFGIQNFFNEKSSILQNEKILNLFDIKNYIFNDMVMKFSKLPECYIYYATTGKWCNDKNISGRIDSDINILKQKNLFSNIKFLLSIIKIFKKFIES